MVLLALKATSGPLLEADEEIPCKGIEPTQHAQHSVTERLDRALYYSLSEKVLKLYRQPTVS